MSPTTQEKQAAQRAVRRAILDGRLTRPPVCSACDKPGGSRDIQAHHVDYAKPLEVTWLCVPCHKYEHQKAEGCAYEPKLDPESVAQAWRDYPQGFVLWPTRLHAQALREGLVSSSLSELAALREKGADIALVVVMCPNHPDNPPKVRGLCWACIKAEQRAKAKKEEKSR